MRLSNMVLGALKETHLYWAEPYCLVPSPRAVACWTAHAAPPGKAPQAASPASAHSARGSTHAHPSRQAKMLRSLTCCFWVILY